MLWQKLLGTNAAGGIEYVGSYMQSFVGTTSNVTVSLTSLTGGLSSAPAAGDLVIVYFGTGSTANRDLVISGYTEIVELYSNDTYDTNLAVAYKFMGGTPDTSFVLTGGTLNIDDAGAVGVQVWRGVDATTPLDVTRTTATGVDTCFCNPAAITPVTDGAVIVAGGASGNDISSIVPIPYSISNLTDFRSVARGDVNDVTIGLGYHVWTSGAFDPTEFRTPGADSARASWAAVTLALRPA
jgi:hypothetical protein